MALHSRQDAATLCFEACALNTQPAPDPKEFLAGANNMDEHFKNQPFQDNLPVLVGLLSIWNVSFLGHGAKAILPYCQVGDPQGPGGPCASVSRVA